MRSMSTDLSSSAPDARLRIALGVAVVAAFSLPLLVGLRYGGLDHTLVHLGMQCALRDGDGLLLDAAMGGGSPVLAEPQSGVFYPITWLLWAVRDPELAASLWSVVHLGIAAWSAALLGARSGLSRSGALAMGAAHALSGTVLNLILHGAYIAGAAWTPLVWAGALGLFRPSPHPRAAAEVAAGLGLLLLAGELQGFAIAVVLVWVELARSRPTRRVVLIGALAVGVGLLVGMMQWLPTFGLRDAIARSGAMSLENQTLWSLGMPELLGMVWPGVATERFSSGATLFHLWTGDPTVRVPWNPTPYVGLAATTLGLGLAWTDRRTRWWAFGATALLLVALGANTPLYGILATLVPPMGLFRYPAKYFAPASIAVLLATFHVLHHADLRRRATVGLAVGMGLAGAGMVGVALYSADLQALSDSFTFGVRTLPGVRPEPAPLLLARAGQAVGLALLLLLVWWRAPRFAPWVVVLDLLLAASVHVEPVEPVLAFDAPRTHLGDPASALICTDPTFPSSRLDSPERDWGLAGVTLVQHMQHKANLHQCGGPAVPQHYLASATAPTVSLWHDHLSRPEQQVQAAVALGCTLLATEQPVAAPRVADDTPAGIAPPVYRLDIEDVLVVDGVLHASAESAVTAAMAADRPAAILRHLDDPTHALETASLPSASGTASLGASSLTNISVPAGPTGVLVFRRPWWPGWQATGNGRSLPVLRAAGARLAVVVDTPADVELRYSPPLLWAGLGVGGVGWLGGLALGWLGWKRRLS